MTTTTNTTTTSTTTTNTHQATVDNYFRCWNSLDATERQAVVERTWTAEARSVDPVADVSGHDDLIAMFAAFHETYVGHSFVQRGGIDEHHGIVRWGWSMIDADGAVALDGIDLALVDDEGRIGYLVGFFGRDVVAA